MKRKSVLGYGLRNSWSDGIKLCHSSYYKIVIEPSLFVMCYNKNAEHPIFLVLISVVKLNLMITWKSQDILNLVN